MVPEFYSNHNKIMALCSIAKLSNFEGNRKRRIVTNFDEEDECDTAFCSAERLYDAEMQS
ncbi:hypothetical protein WUBG_06178 [Wuchereria bancrofti]|uniref:Uncharacterized protein n=1 Tax=Wuchereria bancrofti TaxID=6293 RepID=J9EKB8_WUCBA|nr:hypothetical protein WUBG_06178 [Wuchereria bancrofti]